MDQSHRTSRKIPPPVRSVRRIVVAIAIVAYVAWRIPSDAANTYLAYGLSVGSGGNLAKAEMAFEKSRRWAPNNIDAYDIRAQFYSDQRQFEKAAAEWQARSQQTPRDIAPLLARSEVLLRMGRPVDAIQAAKEATTVALEELRMAEVEGKKDQIKLSKFMYANALNGLAYTRARSMQDIDQGLLEVETAMHLMGGLDANAMLDTRGYLYFLKGDLVAAYEDMTRCCRNFRELYHWRLVQSTWQQQNRVDQSQEDEVIANAKHNLAVGYQHLGLVRAALGQHVQACDDFSHAIRLGYNPELGVW
ncbi:MAG: hypothetical protein O3C60_16470 [Planctomycetota bacterium]|nr:hypothetical protein [Planctomycetota bacterium]